MLASSTQKSSLGAAQAAKFFSVISYGTNRSALPCAKKTGILQDFIAFEAEASESPKPANMWAIKLCDIGEWEYRNFTGGAKDGADDFPRRGKAAVRNYAANVFGQSEPRSP